MLLPVAAASGWFAARRSRPAVGAQAPERLSTSYFRGLNYLLNEQPDKAIEVFLQIAETDENTFETQFALGLLFRRRGEVDRAIRLHQGLVARPGLSEAQKLQAILALGEDYMRAGLLDRAETLFADLAQAQVLAPPALRHLISIYQAERDWEKAIEYAQRFAAISKDQTGPLIAQFHCELSEQARLRGDIDRARQEIASAYEADSHCVRAGMLEARLEIAAGNDQAAIRAYERVARHDVDYLPEVLPPLLACYVRRDEGARARAFLSEMIEHYGGVAPILELARLLEQEDGPEVALDFLIRQLRQRPSVRGEAALIELSLASGSDAAASLQALKQINEQLLVRAPTYRCKRCGFGARSHHWQCPSCKNWDTVKPVHTVLAE
nr:lipopolysaccharide assembly protein LapB [Coralloluteibacterium stylophorae]